MLGLSCTYMLSTGGHVYSVDEYTMLATSRALVHGRRQVAVTPDSRSILAVEHHRSSEEVGVFGIGTSVIAVPPLAAGTVAAQVTGARRPELIVRLFVLMTNSWVTALTAVLLFLLCLELGSSFRGGLILALAYGLGTSAWADAKTMFSEPSVALLLTLSVLLAVRSSKGNVTRNLVWSGLCAAATVLFRVNSAIYVLPLVAYVGLAVPSAADRRRRLAGFGTGLAVGAAVFALDNWWRFGSVFDLGYRHVPFTAPFYEGLFGLLLSPGKGLVFYAPVTIAAVVVPFVARRHRAELALLFGLFLVDVCFFAPYTIWYGGTSWGPRYLYPVLPLVIATLAVVVDGLQWRRRITGLAAAGLVLTLLTGVSTYFVAIAWRDLPRLEAEVHATQSSDPGRLDQANFFVPHDSPIVLALRYLPEAVRHTASRIGGPAEPLPAAQDRFIHFYDTPLQLDFWWAWWLPAGGWPPLLALAPLLLLGAVAGMRRLRRLWREDDRSCAPVAGATPGPGQASDASAAEMLSSTALVPP